jgi:hypothetical protein
MKLPIRRDGENLILSISSPIIFIRVESSRNFGIWFSGYPAILFRLPRLNIYWGQEYESDF